MEDPQIGDADLEQFQKPLIPISLGDTGFHANTECFQGLVPLLPHLRPLSVPKGGGGYVGYIWKALEKRHLEYPRSACCTEDMFEIFVPFGQCVCFLLPLFVNRQLLCLYTNSRAVASPDAPQKPVVRNKARSAGAEWVRVTRCPAKQAEKPHTAGSQQPACSHEEHHILSTAEATAFATQFIKGHSCNLCDAASGAICSSHKQGDVCPNGVPALVERARNDDDSDSE